MCLNAAYAKVLIYNIFTNEGKYIKNVFRYKIPLSIKKNTNIFNDKELRRYKKATLAE